MLFFEKNEFIQNFKINKMKPKIFIGSSVEGLNIAYSIQQNLMHDAEITVWDQGVFELSKTTIESLIEKLNDSDFGIFVFSDDDMTIIRDTQKSTVRDNVLFEFGLFIGKLSRERVYFIIPSETDLHLPTDILGITPGKYESNRSDGSMQAATGPVANQIRQMIKKMGKRIEREETANSPANIEKSIYNEDLLWIDDLISKKYEDAKDKLKKVYKNEKIEKNRIEQEIWMGYCDFKLNEIEGEKNLIKILNKNLNNIDAIERIARIFYVEDYLDKAVEILNSALVNFKNNFTLIDLLADCLNKIEDSQKAIEYLKGHNPEKNADIAMKIASIYVNNNNKIEARKILHNIYMKYPNNEKIKYKYALIAIDLKEYEIALYLLKSLTNEFPKNSDYWGYLSNCAIYFEFHNLSIIACKKAEELSKSKENWIISNIGNILNNRGFYSDAINYFEKSIELNKENEYAHKRLSEAINNREEEEKKIELKRKEGLKTLRTYIA